MNTDLVCVEGASSADAVMAALADFEYDNEEGIIEPLRLVTSSRSRVALAVAHNDDAVQKDVALACFQHLVQTTAWGVEVEDGISGEVLASHRATEASGHVHGDPS